MRVGLTVQLLCVSLLVTGCIGPRIPPSEYDVHIRNLSSSSSQNRGARMALKAAGQAAVPRLIREVDHSASHLRNSKNALDAMRAMRVLREIGTPDVLPVCRRLLTEEYFPPKSKQDSALLNEVLEMVYDHFKTAEARDIFCKYITGDSSRYVRHIRRAQHWGPAVYQPRVEVDVVRGLRLLVNAKDDRAGDALTAFLRSIDIGSLNRTYYHRLAENGYAVTEAASGKAAAQLLSLSSKTKSK